MTAMYQRGQASMDRESLDRLQEIPGFDPTDCIFGIETHEDGRVWVCINGSTFLRFKPNGKPKDKWPS